MDRVPKTALITLIHLQVQQAGVQATDRQKAKSTYYYYTRTTKNTKI